MGALSLLDKERCYFHLGYGSGSGIPAGDVAQLEEAVRSVRSDYQLRRIKDILNRCDSAWEQTELGQGVTTTELYVGDINRSVSRTSNLESIELWRKNYLKETDMLAQQLNVPNYQHEDIRIFQFSRFGGEYVKSIPGVADTSIGTKIYLARRFA